MVGFRVEHLPIPRGAPAAKNGGRSHHLLPSRRCAGRGGDTRGAASLRLSTAEAEIRVVPRLMRRFVGILNHNGEGADL